VVWDRADSRPTPPINLPIIKQQQRWGQLRRRDGYWRSMDEVWEVLAVLLSVAGGMDEMQQSTGE